MNVDRYTKAVLTVIAGCLLWICAMGAGPSLSAQPASSLTIPHASVQPVVVVGSGTLDPQGTVTVNYVRQPDGHWRTDPAVLATLPYTAAKPLPVSLPYTAASPLPASLPYTPASPMPARLTNSPETPLPVEITAVKKVGEWEPLRARVEDASAKPKPGGGDR
jgi:hypothetical protein